MEATIDTTEVRSWKRYGDVEDTGVEWLSKIPAHWEAVRIKYLCQVKRGASPRPIDDTKYFDSDGEYAWVRIADVTASDRYLERTTQRLSALGQSKSVPLEPGRLFLSIAATVGKPVITKIKCCIHDGFVYFVGLKQHQEFWYYVFTSGQAFFGLGKMGTQLNLNTETIGNITMPVPPPEEQQAIVAFLDRETARIDALIGHKERLIALLEEKRQAVISHAVTRGLAPNAKMKDSGCDIIGMVPTHWRPMKLKYLFQFAKRQGFPDETVLSVYRDYGVIEKSTRDDNHNRTPLDLTSYQLVEPGDLVINKMKSWQGSLGISNLRGITSPDYVVYRSTNSEHLPYLHQLLRSRQMATYYHTISNGIRNDQWRLEPDKFEQTVLYLPSVDEQQAIAEFIIETLSEADVVRSKIHEGIERLEEYRTALISAAVTGQIDVREEVAASDG